MLTEQSGHPVPASSLGLVRVLLTILCLHLVTRAAHSADLRLTMITPIGFAESQLWNCNTNGDAIGLCEIYDSAGASIAVFPCLASTDSLIPLPRLEGYKLCELFSLSDTGLAVGHAYSPIDSKAVKLRAVIVDAEAGKVTELDTPDPQSPAIATSICKDGTVIAGVVSGKPNIWERSDNSWRAVSLPLPDEQLTTQKVFLCDNGTYAVAGMRSQATALLCTWQLQDRVWLLVSKIEAALSPTDVNDHATVVGSQAIQVDGKILTRGFQLQLDGSLSTIEPLEGDTFSTLRSINNQNVAVGWSDAVGVANKGPRSIQASAGKVKPIDLGNVLVEASQAFAINDSGQVVGLLSRRNDPHSVGFILEKPAEVDKEP